MTHERPGSPALHRHQLARLTPAGWQRLLARAWDAQARECLAHWADHRLPLVVTRQPAQAIDPEAIAMGLPAPGRWGRRRFSVAVRYADVSYFDEFPRLAQVVPQLPHRTRGAWQGLCAALAACGASARVHGSHGWRHITGLDHVHADSDIDLCIAVPDAVRADAVAQRLQALACTRPRIDGELVFANGDAIAWREWLAWRGGRTKALLVKRLHGCSLIQARREEVAA
jgi:phosphoribosyl-dephospho-CoA transferase